MRPHIVFALAALLAGLAVVLGAFGAHGLKAHLAEQQLATYQTATEYLMYHALALIGIAAFWQANEPSPNVKLEGDKLNSSKLKSPKLSSAVITMLCGVLLFSGSLYLLLLTGQRWLVWCTPLGGLLLILAWLMIAWQGFKLAKWHADSKHSAKSDD